jgi:putative membrane protein
MHWLTLLTPWLFSPTVIAATGVAAVLYVRGVRRHPVPVMRQVSFWFGLALVYAAMHTRVDYYAEREFFVHRTQHMVLHHMGPFFIALAWPGPALFAGLPARLRRRASAGIPGAHVLRALWRAVTGPVITGVLFVGLIWLWLIPTIHFYAMLDVHLYRLMNWSMLLDGLLFWFLTLDPRSQPPARLSRGARVVLLAAIIPPQVASGAMVTFATSNLYPLYELCGRAFAGISARQDQSLGGLVLWVPSTMMSLIGVLTAMYWWFKSSEESEKLKSKGVVVRADA